MKRIASLAALCLLVGFAFGADPQPASDNAYVNDFTTGMGKWTANKCESTQDASGVKLTKIEKLGGIGIEDVKEDLSAYKTADFEMVNEGKDPIKFAFKIKSGKASRTDDKGYTLKPGTQTISFKLAGGDIDLAKVDYMKIWVANPDENTTVTIKNVSFSGGAAATTQPATSPAK